MFTRLRKVMLALTALALPGLASTSCGVRLPIDSFFVDFGRGGGYDSYTDYGYDFYVDDGYYYDDGYYDDGYYDDGYYYDDCYDCGYYDDGFFDW